MEALTQYLGNMPEWHRITYLIAILASCWVLERLTPLFRFGYSKLKHDAVNLTLLAANGIVQAIFLTGALGLMFWANSNQFGLLYLVDLPLIAEFIIALLVLDFIAQWGMHYLLHHVKWLWRLHMVHHGDTHVDATTGTRLHPFDFLSREVAATFAVVTFGIPVTHYILYRLITMFFTYFTHANIRLPDAVDRALSYVFVTPNVHKFHHHVEAPWTDSNYGNVLSVWDRLMGTYVYDDTGKIEYGLDVLNPARDEELRYLLTLPWDSTIGTNNRPGFFERYAEKRA